MSKLLITLEIETRIQTDDNIIKTEEEIKNAIGLYDHDVVDGFELTTNFEDCDNTSDFFLKDANIVSIKSEKELEYIKSLEENEIFRHEDLQESIKLFYELNQHYNGEPLAFAEWVRAVHEINEDFEERIIEIAENVCDSLKKS